MIKFYKYARGYYRGHKYLGRKFSPISLLYRYFILNAPPGTRSYEIKEFLLKPEGPNFYTHWTRR